MEKRARYFQPLMHMTLVPSPYRAPGNEANMGLDTRLAIRLSIAFIEETNRQTARGSLAGTFSVMTTGVEGMSLIVDESYITERMQIAFA